MNTNHTNFGEKKNIFNLRNIVFFCLILFSITCIFDPADLILSLKIPLFILCLALTLTYILNKNISFSKEILLFSFLFLAIPIYSIIFYFITNGSYPYEGFSLLKAYLLILLIFPFYIFKINFIKTLSIILTILSLTIITTYIFLFNNYEYYDDLYFWGNEYGLINIGDREYSGDFSYFSVFFVTSPMIIVSLAYFFNKFINTSNHQKYFYLILTIINILGMILAGTRNNFIMSIITPLLIYFSSNRNSFVSKILIMIFLIILFISQLDFISLLFDKSELSNNLKINLFYEYIELFSDPFILLFGQGLGSYNFWEVRSYEYFITELTYFEIIRNFGLIFGIIIIFLMIYPVTFFNKRYITREDKSLLIAYFLYLIMTITNPLFFPSLEYLYFV